MAKLAWDSTYSPIRDPERVKRQLDWSAITREEFAEAQGKEYMRDMCLQLWRSPKLNWNGLVLGCCWTQDGFGGNAFREGYVHAINNDKIRFARRMLLGKESARDDIACSKCKLYTSLLESGRFLSLRDVHGKPLWYRAAACLPRLRP